MAADEKQVSALFKRHDQIKRWEDSDTNLEPILPKRDKTAVQFQDGCVFLAACSSGDKDEVAKLLRSKRSADINTANVDGLTALHQACIDDNLEMVEFLVEHGADIDVCDNEGWTPLHATASCAFLEIARYLINHNANVAAVNNDGDLPIDIAENEEMENLLQKEMNRQGIDAVAARCGEEQRMLEDANQWLADKTVKEIQHPKTGATALHVAAAKGYIKVMNLLLEAGVDINSEDYDGWTPLHAAAHWGQEEACKILVENMCDMSYKNKAGHTAFDLAENGMLKLLEELKVKQASIQNEQEKGTDIILSTALSGKRRSSVTRMSGDQKQNVLHRTSDMEQEALSTLHPGKTDVKIAAGSETEHQNDKIKPVPAQTQLQERLSLGRGSSSGSTGISTAATASTTTSTTTASSTTSVATDVETKPADRFNSTLGQSFGGYRSSFTGRSNSYVPFYMRQQREAQAGGGSLSNDKPASHEPAPSSPVQTRAGSSTVSTNSVFRRSYEPPKRDEETETQRKARAKHARQTRRSTQGVSLEDIEKAEESIQRDKNGSATSTTPSNISSSSSSLRNSATTKETTSVGNGDTVSSTGIPTATTTTTISSSTRGSNPDPAEDKSVISGYRRWASEDKADSSDAPSTRSSYRRSRLERDLAATTGVPDITVSYIPRSQRNSALQPTENSTSTPANQSSQTNQSSDQVSAKAQDESKKDESSNTQEKKEEKKESTSLRARRQRRERRSTGIGLDSEDGEAKPDEDDKDDNQERENSSSDVVTKSSSNVNIDYKKKYEEEKVENERLKKELDVTKKGLLEAKTELDRANRLKDNTRNTDRDKRILERKLTDMEEELKKVESLKAENQKLKDENGALIRVISKLSK